MVRTVRDLNRLSWEAIYIEWSQSDLSKRAFCAQRDISYKTFVSWCGRNKDVVARIPAPATNRRRRRTEQPLIPIHVVAGDQSHPSRRERPCQLPATAITITTPGGLSLQVNDGFNEQTLLRVLKTLKEAV